MSVATVRAVLVAAAPVTTLVPEQRIEGLRRTQSFAIPAVTLTDVSLVPFAQLRGHAGLNAHLVQVDCYGATYTQALDVAAASFAALEAAGYIMQSQIERNEPETDPELFQVTQTWSVLI